MNGRSRLDVSRIEMASKWYKIGARNHHSLEHALDVVDRCREAAGPSKVLELAALYHRAVNLPGFAENPEASARAFLCDVPALYASGTELTDDEVSNTMSLIRGTTEALILTPHRLEGVQAVLMDACLAELGGTYWSFVRGQKAVSEEAKLGQSRSQPIGLLNAVLLAREHVYHTDFFREAFEEQTRANISRFAENFV